MPSQITVKFQKIFRMYDNGKFKHLPTSLVVDYKNRDDLHTVLKIQLFLIKDLINYDDIESSWKINIVEFHELITDMWQRLSQNNKHDDSNFLLKEFGKILQLLNDAKTTLVEFVWGINRLYAPIFKEYSENNVNILKLQKNINEFFINNANICDDRTLQLAEVMMQRFIFLIKRPYPFYSVVLLVFSHLPILAYSKSVNVLDAVNGLDVKDVCCNLIFSDLKEHLLDNTEDSFMKLIISRQISGSAIFYPNKWYDHLQQIDRDYIKRLVMSLKYIKLKSDLPTSAVEKMDDSESKIVNIIEYHMETSSNLHKIISDEFDIPQFSYVNTWFLMHSLLLVFNSQYINLLEYSTFTSKVLKRFRSMKYFENIDINKMYIYNFFIELRQLILKMNLFNSFDVTEIVAFVTKSELCSQIIEKFQSIGTGTIIEEINNKLPPHAFNKEILNKNV